MIPSFLSPHTLGVFKHQQRKAALSWEEVPSRPQYRSITCNKIINNLKKNIKLINTKIFQFLPNS
jgi:hypothetical protein